MRGAGERRAAGIASRLPIVGWARTYDRDQLIGDALAGTIVAVMLVPQAMAYAMLAGLPPQVGLYASILPLLLYALLGTSRTLAVGPVAMVSLLVANAIAEVGVVDVGSAIAHALVLAAMVGLLQLGMGLLRMGFVVNYLSHPVLSGFTSAAAVMIGFSQLKHLLGVSVARQEHFYETVVATGRAAARTNTATLALALLALAILVLFRTRVADWLLAAGVSQAWVEPVVRAAPLFVVALGTLVVGWAGLDVSAGVRVVGSIPAGLPGLGLPSADPGVWRALLPTALLISFVGFMESASVARVLASRRRQKIDADQELVALGVANLGAALTGGYPVTGGFSRSVVNFSAGARTGLSSMITALLVAGALMFLTPLFYYLPTAVLAAIIVVAVAGLIDVATLRHVWSYSRADGLSLATTFVGVLALGIERGIVLGALTAALLFLWRTSKPHYAVVGRLGATEHFRNVDRHRVATSPRVLALRIDESLYFANTRYLEDQVLRQVADRAEVEHLLLIMSAVNFIDASALETLEQLHAELSAAGVAISLAEVKGPVMDRLQRVGFVDRIGAENIHLSTYDAWQALGCDADARLAGNRDRSSPPSILNPETVAR